MTSNLFYFLFLCQFNCDREDLLKCVAGQLNISDSVTLCLLHNLTGLVEDPFLFCPRQPSACPLPEVSVCDHLYMFDVCTVHIFSYVSLLLQQFLEQFFFFYANLCKNSMIYFETFMIWPVFMVTVWSHVVWWCCPCASSISHTVCCWLCCAALCTCTSAV